MLSPSRRPEVFMTTIERSRLWWKWYAANCGHRGYPKTVTKGALLIEMILWVTFLVPGVIYSIWRHSSRYQVCPSCGAPHMVLLDSSRGRDLQGTEGGGAAVPAAVSDRGPSITNVVFYGALTLFAVLVVVGFAVGFE